MWGFFLLLTNINTIPVQSNKEELLRYTDVLTGLKTVCTNQMHVQRHIWFFLDIQMCNHITMLSTGTSSNAIPSYTTFWKFIYAFLFAVNLEINMPRYITLGTMSLNIVFTHLNFFELWKLIAMLCNNMLWIIWNVMLWVKFSYSVSLFQCFSSSKQAVGRIVTFHR